MRYLPYDQSRTIPHIVVNGRGNDRSVLVLSHWPRAGTPEELKADTSVEIVLRFLRSPLRTRYSEITTVTNNHLDVDGLLSVWAMLNPDKALTIEPLLAAAAATGDFDRAVTEEGLRAAITLTRLLEPAADYQRVLPQIERLLFEPARFRDFWEPAMEEISRDVTLLRKEGRQNEFPHVDLAVFDLPRAIHPITLLSSTVRHRVLTIYPGPRYHLRYKYETWVELASYTPPPRIDLGEFSRHLATLEHAPRARWTWDRISSAIPSLRFMAEDGTLTPSALSPEGFLARLIRYLEDSAGRPEREWRPADWTG